MHSIDIDAIVIHTTAVDINDTTPAMSQSTSADTPSTFYRCTLFILELYTVINTDTPTITWIDTSTC